MSVPTIPPRPSRSRSSGREPPAGTAPAGHGSLHDPVDRASFARSPLNDLPEASSPRVIPVHVPDRPPSVSLPSVGHEGDEYAGSHVSRSIAHDLPLHQPTAAVPQSTAESRIQTVTKEAQGTHDEEHHHDRIAALRTKPSMNGSTTSLLTTSDLDVDPNGVRVPMYPNAGFVQAPSPAPSLTPQSAGLHSQFPAESPGGHRKTTSRQEFGPPGSYGMHHGAEPRDKFERAWYQKHPEEAGKLHYIYDPCHDRSSLALSSDDLNKLVQQSVNGFGMATSPAAIGTPTEQIGYRATEEYTEINSDTVHIDPVDRQLGKFVGSGYDPPTEDLGVNGGNSSDRGGYIHEKGRGVPILASDELAKSPNAAMFMQPAVEPEQELQADGRYHSAQDPKPPSYQSGPVPKIVEQLDEIEEFEPLFTDDDGAVQPVRPDLRRHFPSMDVWEDTPNSHALTTTVSTPDIETAGAAAAAAKKETAAETETETEPEPKYEKAKPKFNPSVVDTHRPGLPRFPSSDVWEDSPDSSQLQTTVASPQANVMNSPEIAAKTAPTGSIPAIPRRPSVKVPIVPDRPRGVKPIRQDSQTSQTSQGSQGGQDEIKVKPPVPARPGSKIGALKAGFMSDLNSRLQMGPPTSVHKETVDVPLVDARKGRAKGPARRKPAAETETAGFEAGPVLSICMPRMLFSLAEDGVLRTGVVVEQDSTDKVTEDAEAV